jgi:hypothetical protein
LEGSAQVGSTGLKIKLSRRAQDPGQLASKMRLLPAVANKLGQDLHRLLRVRKITTKSEAIRLAVRESLERSLQETSSVNYREWIDLAKGGGENLQPRFRSHDELWS